MDVEATREIPEHRGGHQAGVDALRRINADGTARPDLAPVRHGLHMAPGVCLQCSVCPVRSMCPHCEDGAACIIESEYMEQRIPQIVTVLREDGHEPALHAGLIDALVYEELRLQRARRYLAVHGEMDEEAHDYRGAAKEIPKIENQLVKLLQEMNLTPRARAALEQNQPDTDPLARAILALDARSARANDDIHDAEMDETDDEDTETTTREVDDDE